MIGVIANPADHDVVREFFELFKTPWEFYHKGSRYDVLLSAGEGQFDGGSKLVVSYAGRKLQFDDEQRIQTGRERKGACALIYQGNRIPIYGDTLTYPSRSSDLLRDEKTQECAAYLERSSEKVVARIGYDLFSEIRALLTTGQPAANAQMPALELHIAFLRDLITGCGVPLVEIPPAPDGYQFVACLTHDVDHPSIRQHKWDHTVLGFLFRAVFGSLWAFISGQMPIQDLLANWVAALKLPLVYLGLAKDFWGGFDNRYRELEKGLRSTYFVIPFKNHPGRSSRGQAPMRRASRYGAQDIADTIRKITASGCEVGLHGIDAWLDYSKGREELKEIRRVTGGSEIGVRMHWLYYDQQSPSALETAGASYDSTIGYNETVGYRAGTTQVYKPLDVSQLLELPLHVMDTALFYLSYLGLSPRGARKLVGRMVDRAVQFGGTLTINWHDRSLAPERLWGAIYRDLIQEMKSRGAWFSTAGQAIAWFRKRRSASFETDNLSAGEVRVKVAVDQGDHLPGLRLRIHKGGKPSENSARRSEDYADKSIDESVAVRVHSEARR